MSETIVAPLELRKFLNDIVDSKFGFSLGAPWKYSEKSLGVVVPITRTGMADREYATMYEVLKDLNLKDTGSINGVELQNKTGKAVFIRAGTIFKGTTQNRATQHSGVYTPDKEEIIPVRCVHQTHGIRTGSTMTYGDIAPMSVTMNLMSGDQSSVWQSVRRYTSGTTDTVSDYGIHTTSYSFMGNSGNTHHAFSTAYRARSGGQSASRRIGASMFPASHVTGSDDLLGHLQKTDEAKSLMDEMMQKVPLFENQVGAIIFNPVGVIALETFDHPKSWEAVKKEIIEKYGDKIKKEQEDHIFELKPEMIKPSLKKFIDNMTDFKEKTIRIDDFSETKVVSGTGIIGEYTVVKGQPIHVLLYRTTE